LRFISLRTLGQQGAVIISVGILAGGFAVSAEDEGSHFRPGNLVVSRSVYDNDPDNVQVGMTLPPNCVAHDKIGKDTNFRGLTIFDNVIYYSKGSGGNGINTVYFVDTTGLACPSTSATPGVGLPMSSASLPTSGLNYNPMVVQSMGLVPTNMCILAGFPTLLASASTGVANPFGLWFANDHTFYVADEGDGTGGATPATFYDHAAAQHTAGLQKWVLNATTHTWMLAYTVQAGLGLGLPYTVANYPAGNNPATGLPWAPATDGLRNITGRVNRDGTVTIWGITSTVSGGGDQGADPNKLVAITDDLAATTSDGEHFSTLRTAQFGEVLRGVSLTPGTGVASCDDRRGDDRECGEERDDRR
jgi:hypothetical protein